MVNAAKLFIAKHNREPKVNRAESTVLATMSVPMRALIFKIDAINAQLYLSRLPSEETELRHKLAGLNLEVSRLALAEDIAAYEASEQALIAQREQEARDEIERLAREEAARVAREEEEAAARVREHNDRIVSERRQARDPLVTKLRGLTAEFEEANREYWKASAKVDELTRKGYDSTFPVFVEAGRNFSRLAGYVARINADIKEVTAELEALPPLEL